MSYEPKKVPKDPNWNTEAPPYAGPHVQFLGWRVFNVEFEAGGLYSHPDIIDYVKDGAWKELWKWLRNSNGAYCGIMEKDAKKRAYLDGWRLGRVVMRRNKRRF